MLIDASWSWRRCYSTSLRLQTDPPFLLTLTPTPQHQRAAQVLRSSLRINVTSPFVSLQSSIVTRYKSCLPIRSVPHLFCAIPSSLLIILELRTPPSGKFGAGVHGGQALRISTSNPFAALDAVAELHSDGSGATSSPTSSGGSLSQSSYPGNGPPYATPSRGFVLGNSPSARGMSVSRRLLSFQLRTIH
jgi:hypothetical protein